MIRKIALVSCVCLLAVVALQAQQQTLRLKDGRSFTGDVTQTAQGYQVKVSQGGGYMVYTFPADQVQDVVAAVDPKEEYNKRREKADLNSATDLYNLAEWAMNNGMLKQAQTDVQAALKINPNDPKSSILLRQINDQLKREAVATTVAPRTSEPVVVPGAAPKTGSELLVSEQDINRIRIQELRKDDTGVAIEFRNDILNRFVRAMRGKQGFKDINDEDRFMALSRLEQVLSIRREWDRNADVTWMDDIAIKSDPRFMLDFRQKVWPTVAQFCATNECHGSDTGKGGLKLFNPPTMTEAILYTDFVILDGVATRGGRPIDRDYPDKSLILQYGLPRKTAQLRHPMEIRYAYTAWESANFQTTLKWITALERNPHPEYHLTYKAPYGMKFQTGVTINITTEPAPTSKPARP